MRLFEIKSIIDIIMCLIDGYLYRRDDLNRSIYQNIRRIEEGQSPIGLNVVTSEDALNVSKLTPSVNLFTSQWMKLE